jgi:uridine kinase
MSAAEPFVIGVAGGTGSGKTTVAERLAEEIAGDDLALLRLDSYYADSPHLPIAERAAINYDHPDAFDWSLLLAHVHALRAGIAVDVPDYDFTNYRRTEETTPMTPGAVLVIEGILVLYPPELRELMSLKIFVDTDPDVRFIRRLERDIAQRGRTPESVISQYLGTVRPSHVQFCEPTKRFADVIVPHGGLNQPALDMLVARVNELVGTA